MIRPLSTTTIIRETLAEAKNEAAIEVDMITSRGDTFVRTEAVKTVDGYAIHIDWTEGQK